MPSHSVYDRNGGRLRDSSRFALFVSGRPGPFSMGVPRVCASARSTVISIAPAARGMGCPALRAEIADPEQGTTLHESQAAAFLRCAVAALDSRYGSAVDGAVERRTIVECVKRSDDAPIHGPGIRRRAREHPTIVGCVPRSDDAPIQSPPDRWTTKLRWLGDDQKKRTVPQDSLDRHRRRIYLQRLPDDASPDLNSVTRPLSALRSMITMTDNADNYLSSGGGYTFMCDNEGNTIGELQLSRGDAWDIELRRPHLLPHGERGREVLGRHEAGAGELDVRCAGMPLQRRRLERRDRRLPGLEYGLRPRGRQPRVRREQEHDHGGYSRSPNRRRRKATSRMPQG